MELKVTKWQRYDDGIALLTLNRPDRLNAWTGRMEREVRHLLAGADDDPGVRVIVITGAGRGFCAGADVGALEKEVAAGRYDPGLGDQPVARPGAGVAPDFDHLPTFLMGMSTPVIAAIGGPAAGLGFVLACCCDVRFAAAGAKMTAAHGPLGLPAEMAVSWVLPRIVGLGRAADLLISSRVILGDEAADLGLVNAALPTPEATVEHAFTYAREMARRVAPASLAASKRQLYLDQLRSLDDSARDARTRLDEHMAGPDFAEGVAALSERRPPRWG